jgi:type I restriction enzyme, S subunit
MNQGYKRTDIGVFPKEWQVRAVGDICDFIVPGRNKPKQFDGHIPWITTPDLAGRQSVGKSRSGLCISREEARRVGSRIVPPGSIVMSCVGELGIVAFVDTEIVINQQLHAFIPSLNIDAKFLLHTLQMQKQYMTSVSTITAVPYLNKDNCNSIPIAVPPLAEQQAIVAILTNVDALVDALGRLIVKKRDLKNAAMQQLLTGKRRLPGFQSEWRMIRLGDVIDRCFSGATPLRSRPEFYKGNIRWITSGELNYNTITDTSEKISPEAVLRTNLKVLPKNTFLMAITGLEAEGTRGSCGIVGAEATTNQSCMAVFPKPDLTVEYLFHYYVLRGKELALKYCQGTKQQSYTAKIVRLLPILLPPVEEQRAIATVLSDMDAEIAALEKRREKTRLLKQGMMQELLTGRTRLV